MYFVNFKARRSPDCKEGNFAIAFCSYWVDTENKETAINEAVQHAKNKGLIMTEVVGTRLSNREFWLNNSEALAVFDYASVYGVGGLIDTYDGDTAKNN
jgi:hypothetical protein